MSSPLHGPHLTSTQLSGGRFKLCRKILGLVANFNRVDLTDDNQIQCHSLWNYLSRQEPDVTTRGTKVRRPKPIWPMLLEFMFIYFLVRMLINQFFQYKYDIQRLKVRILQKNSTTLIMTGSCEQYLRLVDSLAELKATLKSIGAPFMHSSFFIAAWHDYLILAALNSYVLYPLVIRLGTSCQFKLGRVILNLDRERDRHSRILSNEVRRFVQSRENFSSEVQRGSLSPGQINKLANVGGLVVRQNRQLIKRLEQMMAEQQIEPLNWSFEWYHQMSFRYNCCIISIISLTVVIATSLVLSLPVLFGKKMESDWMDLVTLVEGYSIGLMMCFSFCFYDFIGAFNCFHEIRYINELNKLVDRCTATNKRGTSRIVHVLRCSHLHDPSSRLDEWTEEINSNLLYTLMHYRIFVVSLRPTRQFLAQFTFISMLSIWLLPAIVLLHEPYLELGAKVIFLVVCFLFVIVINFCMIPVCHIQKRSVYLYKSICSLLASLVDSMHSLDAMAASLGATRRRSVSFVQRNCIYNMHLVWMIRKELSHPEMISKQFTTIVLGTQVSYPNLLRFHFWFGLVLLFLMYDVSSAIMSSTCFNRFFSDPFGLL